MVRKLLGLSAGSRGGSVEVVLKEALRAAADRGVEVALVRIHDLRLTAGPGAAQDDSGWFWDQLMESDGLIVASPIYSRTVPGLLRLLGDKISGPQADVVFTDQLLRMRRDGTQISVDFDVDERVLRPRVAGFIAVGGSLSTRWKSLTLPLLHTLTASAQIAVVDQVEFAGAGSPGSIVLDEAALERSRQLGVAVADQLGRPFKDAEYRGTEGACPVCHLSVVSIVHDGVECAACGARGRFESGPDGPVVVFDPAGRLQSIITLEEKLDHFREVQETAARQAPLREGIDAQLAAYAGWDPTVMPAHAD